MSYINLIQNCLASPIPCITVRLCVLLYIIVCILLSPVLHSNSIFSFPPKTLQFHFLMALPIQTDQNAYSFPVTHNMVFKRICMTITYRHYTFGPKITIIFYCCMIINVQSCYSIKYDFSRIVYRKYFLYWIINAIRYSKMLFINFSLSDFLYLFYIKNFTVVCPLE